MKFEGSNGAYPYELQLLFLRLIQLSQETGLLLHTARDENGTTLKGNLLFSSHVLVTRGRCLDRQEEADQVAGPVH